MQAELPRTGQLWCGSPLLIRPEKKRGPNMLPCMLPGSIMDPYAVQTRLQADLIAASAPDVEALTFLKWSGFDGCLRCLQLSGPHAVVGVDAVQEWPGGWDHFHKCLD